MVTCCRQNRTSLGPAALAFLFVAALLFAGAEALALGTPAGTVITNTATVNFTVSGTNYTQSDSASLQVAERLELTLTWQDAGLVSVAPGQTNAVTIFRLTNIGNGNDGYTLSATGTGIGGDQFDPMVTAIHLDANGNNAYDPGIDPLYTTGTGTIPADGFQTIFVLSTIPAGTLNTGDLGIVELISTSSTGTGPAGTIVPGAGEGGTDAVIGASQGSRVAAGSYVISVLTVVNIAKTAVVSDPYGGTRPQPGATIRYTLTVTVAGPGTVNSVVITDAFPTDTTYSAGTLVLDSLLLTDAADADAGDAGITTPGAVTIALGSMTSASPARTITFDVTIN